MSLRKQIQKKKDRLQEKADVEAAFAEAEKQAAATGGVILPSADVHRVPGQNYVVLSYATADGSTKVRSTKGLCMKFSGAFRTEDEARAHAKAIRDEDPRFDVSVVDMYVWGVVPLPDEERPFVQKEYTDPILTRAILGLQRSMMQGKKELEERKARDRAKAEAQMRKVKGPDYKMPEKSVDLLQFERRVKEEREAEEAAAKAEHRDSEVAFTSSQISNVAMMFFADKQQSAGAGADFMKYFSEKTIELEAQLRRARENERLEAPLPTPAEVQQQEADLQAGAAAQ